VLAETESGTTGLESLPATPEITPATPPKPPEDRADKNGAAKALAMAGAAFAMISCMDLYRQAAKAQDETEKALLKSMAGQQCSQGMQNAADAAKNDDSKSQLSQADAPKQAQLKTNPFQAPKSDTNDRAIASTPTATPTDDTPTDSPTPTEETKKEEVTKARPSDTGKEIPSEEKANKVLVDLTSTPGAIDGGRLGFDESAKPGSNLVGANGNNPLGPNAFFSLGSAPSAADLKKLREEAEAAEKSGRRARGGAGGADTESAAGGDAAATGAGGSASGSGKDDPFQGMLNQLMGGGPAAEAGLAGAGFGGSEIVSPGGKNGASPKGPNIFEYANYRFRHLTYNDGRIKARVPKSNNPSASTLSSESTTKVATSQPAVTE